MIFASSPVQCATGNRFKTVRRKLHAKLIEQKREYLNLLRLVCVLQKDCLFLPGVE